MVDKKKIEFQKQLWRLGDPYRNEPLGKEVFDEVGYRDVSYTKPRQHSWTHASSCEARISQRV